MRLVNKTASTSLPRISNVVFKPSINLRTFVEQAQTESFASLAHWLFMAAKSAARFLLWLLWFQPKSIGSIQLNFKTHSSYVFGYLRWAPLQFFYTFTVFFSPNRKHWKPSYILLSLFIKRLVSLNCIFFLMTFFLIYFLKIPQNMVKNRQRSENIFWIES